jgi:hypothetical protein
MKSSGDEWVPAGQLPLSIRALLASCGPKPPEKRGAAFRDFTMRKIKRAVLGDRWFHILSFSGFNLNALIGFRSRTHCRALHFLDASPHRSASVFQVGDPSGQ